MEKVCINGRIELELPDGFHVLDETEKKDFELAAAGEYVAFSDPQGHILATVGCRNIGIASFLIGTNDAARSAERQIGDAMQGFRYEFTGFVDRTIAGRPSRGFGYTYVSEGTEMSGETCVMKSGKFLYFFNIYYRRSLGENSLKVWKEILDSAVDK